MARSSRKPSHPAAPARAAIVMPRRVWKLEDAKARFSEVVQLALSEGPQRVTRRGRRAVLIVADTDTPKPPGEGEDSHSGWADQLRGSLSNDIDLMALIGPRDRRDRGSRRDPLAKLLRRK